MKPTIKDLKAIIIYGIRGTHYLTLPRTSYADNLQFIKNKSHKDSLKTPLKLDTELDRFEIKQTQNKDPCISTLPTIVTHAVPNLVFLIGLPQCVGDRVISIVLSQLAHLLEPSYQILVVFIIPEFSVLGLYQFVILGLFGALIK